MMNEVFTKVFDEPEFNIKEILRYAGCKKPSDDVLCLLEECIAECKKCLSYRVCWAEFPVVSGGDAVKFPFAEFKSHTLCKNLADAKSAIVFAATVGIGIDRLIAKYGKISPAKALVFQAIGAERIESLCDAFEREQKVSKSAENLFLRPRFSPGYGDFEIDAQRDIFRVLEPAKRIGLALGGSILMSPSKSVTAIIGISKKADFCVSGCDICTKEDCAFREGK